MDNKALGLMELKSNTPYYKSKFIMGLIKYYKSKFIMGLIKYVVGCLCVGWTLLHTKSVAHVFTHLLVSFNLLRVLPNFWICSLSKIFLKGLILVRITFT